MREALIYFWASQVVLVVKNPRAKAGDVRDGGLIPWSGRSPGGGHGSPLQYPCLENSMDRGAWQATVHWSGWVGRNRSDLAQTLTQWTWKWALSRRQWWSGMLQSMGLQSQTQLSDWTATTKNETVVKPKRVQTLSYKIDNHEDIMYSMVTIVNNTLFYIWQLLRQLFPWFALNKRL